VVSETKGVVSACPAHKADAAPRRQTTDDGRTLRATTARVRPRRAADSSDSAVATPEIQMKLGKRTSAMVRPFLIYNIYV
jgi:hypothetical protein